MTPRGVFLPVLDLYRGALNTLWDLRRYDIVIRVNTWSGGLVGQGSKTSVDTPLVVAGGARPKVEQLTARDVIASGGLYQDLDVKVGPFTPVSADFPSGIDPTIFDPPVVGANTEVLFKITGPGLSSGAWFKKVGQDVSGNFGFFIVLRKTGEQNA